MQLRRREAPLFGLLNLGLLSLRGIREAGCVQGNSGQFNRGGVYETVSAPNVTQKNSQSNACYMPPPKIPSGPIHTGRGTARVHKLERFSFDVACLQCGHPYSHQQVPFACIALCVAPASCVDWASIIGCSFWVPFCTWSYV